ncbi:MAG TPA: D-alanyl-D-alanine carboxypeptidase/D-alanyl-D-alanine-endopeptidase [Acidimicrobiales bacterium]|nr:D-alanyl-D-alanine carboxypeptidase/D-alanyl-D-alanine-endopeptidase [Acidimicrobiales bacterium]
MLTTVSLAGLLLLASIAPSAAGGPAAPGAIASAAGPFASAAGPSPPSPALAVSPLATSILSPARLPRTLQAAWAQRAAAASLARAVSPAALGGAAASRASCVAVAQDGRTIYQYHSHRPVLPASNMKLLTATALLDRLGPGYRFRTRVMVLAPPLGGVVHGDLYLVGGGDPLLRLPSYAASLMYGGPIYTNLTHLVPLLEAAGVRQVTGGVVGDASRYDSLTSVRSWPASYAEQGDVGLLSALAVDDGMAQAGGAVPAAAGPAWQAAGIVSNLLGQHGIALGADPSTGTAPSGARTLVSLVSPPLREILKEVLHESDNTAMELMTKELGLKVSGHGSTAAGVAAVRADLAADGLPLEGFVNVDGSGLSRDDRVTCALLLATIERAGAHSILTEDLPVAAESGTLADEMKGTVAAGRVDAKTGSLNGVKALSGWVLPVPGESPGNAALARPLAFSVVLNGLSSSIANPDLLTDRIAVDLAGYPEAPALALFEPSS